MVLVDALDADRGELDREVVRAVDRAAAGGDDAPQARRCYPGIIVARLDPDTFRRLCRARSLLREAREEPITVEAAAHTVLISPFHFIRRFREVFGETPSQYRARERVELARRLLAGGELSVTEVCLEVGFTSLGSFSALFRRRVGMSPSEYRRAKRTLVAVGGESEVAGTPGAAARAALAALEPGCFSLMGALPSGAFRSFREA